MARSRVGSSTVSSVAIAFHLFSAASEFPGNFSGLSFVVLPGTYSREVRSR
jgi:hypothetical protein